MQSYLKNYVTAQKEIFDHLPLVEVEALIKIFIKGWKEDKQFFIFGNGGSGANASHFVTDLGKNASDKLGNRFRCMSLNDNISWITAIGNDYSYEDIFQRQIANYARPGDVAMALSVSGSSPNVIKAIQWAKQNGLFTIALTGTNGKLLAGLADFSIVINSTHYGRVEDLQMGICHMICYSIIEGATGK